jgi:hypothetical protein
MLSLLVGLAVHSLRYQQGANGQTSGAQQEILLLLLLSGQQLSVLLLWERTPGCLLCHALCTEHPLHLLPQAQTGSLLQ